MTRQKTALTYGYKPSEFFKREARVRRGTLDLSVASVRWRIPYFRWLQVSAWVVVFVLIAYFLMGWVVAEVTTTATGMFWSFIAVLFVSLLYFASVQMYAWPQRNLPNTLKIKVGSAPAYPVADFVPGLRVKGVSLPTSEEPDAKKVEFGVEVIYCGGVQEVPSKVTRPKGPVIIALCMFFNEKGQPQAGTIQGRDYVIPCEPEPYLAGDLPHWRAVNWRKIASDFFPEKVTDFTPVLLALHPYTPGTWEPPAMPPELEMELFQ